MKTIHKAALFAAAIIIFTVACVYISITSSGPIILGSEMNTNGQVEYLCLGRGREASQLNSLEPRPRESFV